VEFLKRPGSYADCLRLAPWSFASTAAFLSILWASESPRPPGWLWISLEAGIFWIPGCCWLDFAIAFGSCALWFQRTTFTSGTSINAFTSSCSLAFCFTTAFPHTNVYRLALASILVPSTTKRRFLFVWRTRNGAVPRSSSLTFGTAPSTWNGMNISKYNEYYRIPPFYSQGRWENRQCQASVGSYLRSWNADPWKNLCLVSALLCFFVQ